MKRGMCAIALVACAAGTTMGQAVTSASGGGTFTAFYGGSTGDVVGMRFTVNEPIIVTHLGVWNNSGANVADHQVGIWQNDTMSLLTSNVVTPGSPATGDWNYEPTTSVVLMPGIEYTAGAMYASDDGDVYVSNPAITTATEVNILNGVFPSAGSLGFVYPENDSAGNSGRYGPNFLFRPIPAPGAMALLGLGGLLAARRRR